MTASGLLERILLLPQPDWSRDRLRWWRVLYPIIRGIGLFLAPVRVEGEANIPEGRCILAANHVRWLDPPWLTFALNRPIRFMGKSEMFAVPILGWALRQAGCFGVRRGESDRRAFVTCLRVLEADLPLGLFPEGHRSESGALIRAHPGVGALAIRSGAPIVPVAILGTRRVVLGRFWRRDITIRIGAPFRPPEAESAQRDPQAVADAIMRRVADLLPREMRGVYGEQDGDRE